MLRAAEVVADLEDDKVPADEHVVEIVRVDLEQDRGHSTHKRGTEFLQTREFSPTTGSQSHNIVR